MVSRRDSSILSFCSLLFQYKHFFKKLPDQSVRVGWFPADCVQIQTATPHQNKSGE
jgi:hypothetical protein